MIDTTTDLRLSKEITVSASEIQLQDLAKKLTNMTGVTVVAGYTDADWRVKERRLHVHIKDLPFSTVLTELSKLLDYHISRSGSEGKWAYRIWQDKKARDADSAEIQSLRNRIANELAKAREKVLADAKTALEMKPKDAQKLGDGKQWMEYLAGMETGRAWCELLNSLPQHAKDAWLQGQKVIIQASELPIDLQGLVNRMTTKGMHSPRSREIGGLRPVRLVLRPSGPAYHESDLQEMTGWAGVLDLIGDPVSKTVEEELHEILRTPDGCYTMGILPLIDADSADAGWFGALELTHIKGERAGEELHRIKDDGRQKLVVPSPIPDDPRLLKEIDPIKMSDSKEEESTTAYLIEQLAKKTDLSYLLEDYPELEEVPLLPADKQPVYKVLDSLQTIGFVWACDGDVVRIRPKERALHRTYDIPESLLVKYRKIFDEKGEFSLDDTADLCLALTDAQMHRLIYDDKISSATPSFLFSDESGMLRFYASLSPAQKNQIKTEQGLAINGLKQSQRDRLAKAMEGEMEDVAIKEGTVRLVTTVMEEPGFKEVKFTVEVISPDYNKPLSHTTSIMMPTKESIKAIEEHHARMDETGDDK